MFLPNNYIIHSGNGANLIKSGFHGIFGINELYYPSVKKMKPKDGLWFVKSKKKGDTNYGKIIGFATFVSANKRETGPLISLTPTNEELGWDDKGNDCSIEIHFENFCIIEDLDLYIGRAIQRTVYNYEKNRETILANLEEEYRNIVKYSKIKKIL